jgi:hypothetical protein
MEDMRERFFRVYIFSRGRCIGRFVKSGKGTITDAQYAAAQVWASISAPQGRQIHDGRK